MYGVTIDNILPIKDVVHALNSSSQRLVARVVLDEGLDITPSYYLSPMKSIHAVAGTMAELLDSYYMKRFNVSAFKYRARSFVDTLWNHTDIWEICNECNGEWLGTTSDVVKKMTYAHTYVKEKGGKTALTLYYNGNETPEDACWSRPTNQWYAWALKNVPIRMKNELDYVWLSFYAEDCPDLTTPTNWTLVFNKLHSLFPNAQLGFGETGTRSTNLTVIKKTMSEYYTMNVPISQYVVGGFWWYYMRDCVPSTKKGWTAFNNIISP